MLKQFMLKDKNKPLGVLYYDTEGGSFNFKLDSSIKSTSEVPIGLYPFGTTDIKTKISDNHLKEYLNKRIMPSNRFAMESYLHSLDLSFFDTWAVLEKTRGMTYDDYYWLAKPYEDFHDMHIRYLAENGKEDRIVFPFPITDDLAISEVALASAEKLRISMTKFMSHTRYKLNNKSGYLNTNAIRDLAKSISDAVIKKAYADSNESNKNSNSNKAKKIRASEEK